MSLIVLVYLLLLGLIMGSFINALVWRLHKQLDKDGYPKKLTKKQQKELSVSQGRSMCPNCHHKLAVKDLVPVFSWLSLKGRCRYCQKPISKQYPTVEIGTALLFVASYVWWPFTLSGPEFIVLAGYYVALVCLIAMAIYDTKYTILPSKLIIIGTASYSGALLISAIISGDYERFIMANLAGLLYFLLFLGIYLASAWAVKYGHSSKDWLGGGDVKLAFLLGLLAGKPILVFLATFLASIIGLMFVLPSLIRNKSAVNNLIPFGPFLIIGAILTLWWGPDLLNWYTNLVLNI